MLRFAASDSTWQEPLPTMASSISSITSLNRGLRIFFSEFVRVSFARTVFWQAAAARRRARLAREGVHVPPIAIFSITNQ